MARKRRKRPHGTGSYQYRDGRHVVQWTDSAHNRHTRSFETEAEAHDFRAKACAGVVSVQRRTATLSHLAPAWFQARAKMASAYDYQNRWKNHVEKLLGSLAPHQVTVAELKIFIAALTEKGLSKGSVGQCMALVSSFFTDLVEDGVVQVNPVKLLSPRTRALFTPDTDWKLVPFLRTTRDIVRVHDALAAVSPDVAVAYIVGALAGLRTGEVRALRWEHVDLGARLIHVQEKVGRRSGEVEGLKDKESRYVPITDSLYWYLRNRMPANAGTGLVCSTDGYFLSDHRMGALIARVLAELELPAMRWYNATRHTFGSHWVMNGGTLEVLAEMMGHSSVVTTERYAHLVPGQYSDADRARVVVEPAAPAPGKYAN